VLNNDALRIYNIIVEDLEEVHENLIKKEGNKPKDPEKLKRWEVEIRARLWGSADGPKFGVRPFSGVMSMLDGLIEHNRKAKKMIIDVLERSRNSTAPYILQVIREAKFKSLVRR
jgi:hypothetical protein